MRFRKYFCALAINRYNARMGLLTSNQVAERIGTTDATVRRWLAAGQLKGTKLGTGSHARWVIDERSLAAFLRVEENRQGPKPGRPRKSDSS